MPILMKPRRLFERYSTLAQSIKEKYPVLNKQGLKSTKILPLLLFMRKFSKTDRLTKPSSLDLNFVENVTSNNLPSSLLFDPTVRYKTKNKTAAYS